VAHKCLLVLNIDLLIGLDTHTARCRLPGSSVRQAGTGRMMFRRTAVQVPQTHDLAPRQVPASLQVVGRRPRRTNWPPRQCRICLETVNPTTHMPSESIPGFLQSAPNVTYEDENGRLIRPCMCKGSSKYVHEGCLQAWRHADPSYGRRNYWQCPTCGFRYRLARLGLGRWVASTGK
jgi:hypothetical protein